MTTRILVIGAGPAGARAAQRVAERTTGAHVTLCGDEPALPYDRIALGRVLSGEAPFADLVTLDAPRLRALGVEYRQGTRIAALDRDARVAITTQGERIGWDGVVLATGSRAVRLPLPGAELPGVFLYRTLADVQAMIAAAATARRAVVIGGGLLGLEAAASLKRRGLDVTVVHPLGWPMERQLDEAAGGLLTHRLRGHGLGFAMPARTVAITGEDRATGVLLADEQVLPAEIVVLTVGVRPDTSVAVASGLPVKRAILVDDALRTEDPAILAIGEAAEHDGATIGLVAPALAMAEVAAAVLAGGDARYAPRTDAAALKVSGVAVWSGGEVAPADADPITYNDPHSGHFRRLWLREDRLVGAVLYGDAGDAAFYLDLIASRRRIAAQRAVLALGPDYVRPEFLEHAA